MAAGIIGTVLGATGVTGLIGDALAPYALISSPVRAISYIVPDVVMEEAHTDELAITDHPVETGAAISDHAFKLPARVDMRCGWSNSTAGVEGYVQQVNQMLISLQAKREPFTVYTGKRVYTDMLVARVSVETNAEYENSLMVSISLRQIIRTSTQSTSASSAPAEAQAMPEKTNTPTDAGQTQLVSTEYKSNDGFSTASNMSFSAQDGSLAIAPREFAAGFDTIIVDGVAQDSGLQDGVISTNPGQLSGNLGLFGNYTPNAFVPSANSPF